MVITLFLQKGCAELTKHCIPHRAWKDARSRAGPKLLHNSELLTSPPIHTVVKYYSREKRLFWKQLPNRTENCVCLSAAVWMGGEAHGCKPCSDDRQIISDNFIIKQAGYIAKARIHKKYGCHEPTFSRLLYPCAILQMVAQVLGIRQANHAVAKQLCLLMAGQSSFLPTVCTV